VGRSHGPILAKQKGVYKRKDVNISKLSRSFTNQKVCAIIRRAKKGFLFGTEAKMKRLIPFLLLFVLVLVIGCVMEKHRKYVRDGLLVTGLNREAFLLEWGPPGWSPRGGFFLKGKQTYDWWIYEKKGVELVFLGFRLVTWRTEKTVEELKTLTPSKPQTIDEYSRERKGAPEKK
jgi:hypothetical protein